NLNTNFSGFQSNGPGVRTDFAEFSGQNPNFERLNGFNGEGVGNINMTGPQLTSGEEATRAAYEANTSLLKPQFEADSKRLDEKLRLQGLMPGTEAYDSEMSKLRTAQGQQLNQIANQSVLTGNEVANRNFSSQLAGAQFGNSAQQQQYDQLRGNYDTSFAATT